MGDQSPISRSRGRDAREAKTSEGGSRDGGAVACIEAPAKARSAAAIRARHVNHLERIIERGVALSDDLFDDALNRELDELRRIQFVRLADRVSETIRKLITTYDRHTRKGS